MTDKQKRVIIWARVSKEEQGAANKESIPDQLKRQRELAHKNNWIVIDELVTDFSMDYFTYAEFATAAAEKGWTDPLRMWEHWSRKDFDVLTCRYLDRVGREQSILSEFIGRTMQAGAIIVPLDEASVDSVNHRMTSAIAGLGAAAHIDKLKAGRDLGMKGRAKRGEQISWRIPRFYVLNDDRKLIPDRTSYQRLFDDIYELFIAGTSYEQMPRQLELRGHINNATGKAYDKTMVKRLLMSARTWGHAEFNRVGIKSGRKTPLHEPWITGRTAPPENVFFQRDVCEPIWQGEQREAMIDELERRFYAIRGAARPNRTYAFSQLCICEGCGRRMVMQSQRGSDKQVAAVCHTGRLHRGCPNAQAVHLGKLQDYMTAFIHELLRQPDAATVYTMGQSTSRLPIIDKDIARLQTRIDNLMEIIETASVASRGDYQTRIDKLVEQRDTLKMERIRYELAEREQSHIQQSRLTALDEVQAFGVLNLWAEPQTVQNQLLRKLLGQLRIVCSGGDPVGFKTVENG